MASSYREWASVVCISVGPRADVEYISFWSLVWVVWGVVVVGNRFRALFSGLFMLVVLLVEKMICFVWMVPNGAYQETRRGAHGEKRKSILC